MLRIKKYLLYVVILAASVAFIAGVIVGRNLAFSGADDVSRYVKENELNTESYLLEVQLLKQFKEPSCTLTKTKVQELSHELYIIGTQLDEENAEKKIGPEQYQILKRKYHLMQMRTYLLINTLIKDCNEDQDVILFYFSRNSNLSKEQGYVLNDIVKNYNAVVFAVEYNYSNELNFVTEFYNITTTPSLVINYDKVYREYANYSQVQAEIKQ